MKTSCFLLLLSIHLFLPALDMQKLQSAELINILLPDYSVLGKRIDQVSLLPKPSDGEVQVVYPESINLDLDGPIIYGMIVRYPEKVAFSDLVAIVNSRHKKWSQDKDGKMADALGTTVWRNENARVAFMVSKFSSEIIMIWLDRNVDQKEINGVASELLNKALKAEHEKVQANKGQTKGSNKGDAAH